MLLYTIKNHNPWRTDRLSWVKPLLRPDSVWVAGGALRTLFNPAEKIEDFDLFFRDETHLAITQFNLEQDGWRNVFTCPKGELFTYKKRDLKVQCIAKKFYTTGAELLDSFDFTICQASYDGTTMLVARDMIKSVLKKNLYLHRLTYPVASLNRMMKYRDKGYYVPADTLVGIVMELALRQFSTDELALYID